jgi:ribonuclease G
MNNTALTVNIEAADEICRQLRLRDIGGLIVIDFIDMKNPDHKKALNNRMIELMEKDRAQHTILPLSKFGLMQITRERVRQAHHQYG